MTKNKTIEYIKSDLYRQCGNTKFKSFLFHFLSSDTFRFLFWFRIFHSWNVKLGGG